MFNFTTICESVKRHWIAIVLITALALVQTKAAVMYSAV